MDLHALPFFFFHRNCFSPISTQRQRYVSGMWQVCTLFFKYYRKGSRWRIWFQLLASVMNMYTHTHTLPSTKTVSWCQIRDSPPPSLFPTPITFGAIARHKSRNARRVETRARGVGGFAGWEKWEICEEDQCVIIVFYVPPCDRSLTMGKVC